MSDDENCPDLFDQLALSKYCDQADVPDYNYTSEYTSTTKPKTKPIAKAKAKPKSKSKKPVKKVCECDSDDECECADSSPEEDLEAIAVEAEIKEKTRKIKELTEESKKWEITRARLQREKCDTKSIGKVSLKISKLFFEIQHLQKQIDHKGPGYKQQQEIKALEADIDHLEDELINLQQRLETKRDRLRQLRPYTENEDFDHDRSLITTGADGKLQWNKNAKNEEEDDYDSLAGSIAQRRALAIAQGMYNSDNHVTIRNPQPTSDRNYQ